MSEAEREDDSLNELIGKTFVHMLRIDYDAMVEALRKARKYVDARAPIELLEEIDAALAKVAP